MEREKGVNDVSMFGVIEVKSAENGLNTNGIRQIMRRGTASHKTELSDEWVDLGKGDVSCVVGKSVAENPTNHEIPALVPSGRKVSAAL